MTNTANESEAMEVWQAACDAYEAAARRVSMGQMRREGDQAAARVIATALEARDARIADCDAAYLALSSFFNEEQAECRAAHARIAELEGALEFAWRDGFQNARDCLSDDEGFCLTVDVEEDAWLDSAARRALAKETDA